jgi:type I restriction enzyme M protein
LAGVGDPQIELGDSLEREPARGTKDEGFDLVLTNPPWGVRIDRDRYRHAFVIPMSDATGLFVQHALDQLRPDGRAIVVVPEGMLFHSGAEEQLRRMLLERHTVEAVVALPEGAFLPYTGVKANLLLLRRNGPTRQVRFVSMRSATGSLISAPGAPLDDAILTRAHLLASSPSQDAWDVSVETLANLDWELSVRRRDEGTLQQSLRTLSNSCPVLPLGQLCEIISGRGVPGRDLLSRPAGDPLMPYIRIRDIRDGRVGRASSWVSPESTKSIDPGQRLRLGDVLMSRSGTIGKLGIVQNTVIGGLASQGFFVPSVHG